jgi:hypothetical protein
VVEEKDAAGLGGQQLWCITALVLRRPTG